mmetsp:Transcript_74118/g.239685  ORF Transcript_74118/g.239685 Transcript_74118/m.239685 type:complete len:425 (+) Transcript_74118:257-1531(+)
MPGGGGPRGGGPRGRCAQDAAGAPRAAAGAGASSAGPGLAAASAEAPLGASGCKGAWGSTGVAACGRASASSTCEAGGSPGNGARWRPSYASRGAEGSCSGRNSCNFLGAAHMRIVPSMEQEQIVCSKLSLSLATSPEAPRCTLWKGPWKWTWRTQESWARKTAAKTGLCNWVTSQTLMLPSEEPEARRQPSFENSTDHTGPLWPFRLTCPVALAVPSAPASKDHSQLLPSWLPAATTPSSSGWVATQSTPPPSPPGKRPHKPSSPYMTLQSAMEPSAPTDRARCGSTKEKATPCTSPSWAFHFCTGVTLSYSHRHNIESIPPEIKYPLLENAKVLTPWVCSLSTPRHAPEYVFQRRIVWSLLAVANTDSLGENSRAQTWAECACNDTFSSRGIKLHSCTSSPLPSVAAARMSATSAMATAFTG